MPLVPQPHKPAFFVRSSEGPSIGKEVESGIGVYRIAKRANERWQSSSALNRMEANSQPSAAFRNIRLFVIGVALPKCAGRFGFE
jgi:hypothetical protein